MRDDPVVTGLVTRARNGEEQAWDALVERYAPLIWSICRRHDLGGADAHDAGQRVWLQLVDHLDKIRDPAALPGWLVTTAWRECARAQRAAHKLPVVRWTPDTIKPRRSSGICSPPSATQRCARPSPASPHVASSSPCSSRPPAISHRQRQANILSVASSRTAAAAWTGSARLGHRWTDQRLSQERGKGTAGPAADSHVKQPIVSKISLRHWEILAG